jgi:hypothetical protein
LYYYSFVSWERMLFECNLQSLVWSLLESVPVSSTRLHGRPKGWSKWHVLVLGTFLLVVLISLSAMSEFAFSNTLRMVLATRLWLSVTFLAFEPIAAYKPL